MPLPNLAMLIEEMGGLAAIPISEYDEYSWALGIPEGATIRECYRGAVLVELNRQRDGTVELSHWHPHWDALWITVKPPADRSDGAWQVFSPIGDDAFSTSAELDRLVVEALELRIAEVLQQLRRRAAGIHIPDPAAA
jgi:hypothetical protein